MSKIKAPQGGGFFSYLDKNSEYNYNTIIIQREEENKLFVPVQVLKNIDTISGLKVLLYFYEKSNHDGILKASVNSIIDGSGIARNSARRGIEELLEKKYITVIKQGSGTQPNTYKVSKFDPSISDTQAVPKTDMGGWKRVTGSKAEQSSIPENDPDNINNIIYKDFKDFNLIHNNINSLSIVNKNHLLNDEQLGKLARRVLVEWFLPLAEFKQKMPGYFFPQQMKMLKDMLVEWRTDQVLAAIKYWTKVAPPKNGMKSLAWLRFEQKKVSHMMVALNYYKQQYLETQHEQEAEERMAKVESMKKNALDIVKKKQEEKKSVDKMDDNDFISNLLGGFGKINLKE